MITESFLNSCFTLILNKNGRVRQNKALYRDILEVLDFNNNKEAVEIPMGVKGKLDCLKKVSAMLIEDKTVDNVLDSIAHSQKFSEYLPFLDLKQNEELKDHIFVDIIKQIRLRRKINAMFKNYDSLHNVVESIKDGSFDSLDDVVEDYEVTIKELYSNMMESSRSISMEAAASLDLMKDDYGHVIEMIKRKYERGNTTPTGFPIFDNDVMQGGYEPSRLYVYGGGSGAGKSTILNNTIFKSAIMPADIMSKPLPKPGEINRVYVYITCENTIEEALMRTYQPLFGKTTAQMLDDIREGVDIGAEIQNMLSKCGSTIIMKYFPPMSISPFDLMGVLDDAIDTYGKDSIAGLYVDYLDLLKTDMKYDMYRLELGHITLSLKTLAVQYNIPVITASQLGRSAYRITDSKDLNVDQMSESIKKVEHADFVMLIAKDQNENDIVHGRVGKNRSGKGNYSVEFKVDFSTFSFLSANAKANKKRPDASTATIDSCDFSFPGFDDF